MRIRTDPDHEAFATPDTEAGHGQLGLSKREWFAGMALAGVLASDDERQRIRKRASEQSEGAVGYGIYVARLARNYADDLIEALNEGQEASDG